MKDDLIRYDLIIQGALKGAIRKVLSDAARDGLPGNHHFLVTFKTGAPGVQLSSRMRREYPEEMTIVLQHQFWDMHVDDNRFEVGLSFHSIPEKLSIPFAALTGFADPVAKFELRFDTSADDAGMAGDHGAANNDTTEGGDDGQAPQLLTSKRKDRDPAQPQKDGTASRATKKEPARDAASKHESDAASGKKTAGAGSEPEGQSGGDSKVISIDAFRKKT